ncbi:MAG: 30S ribosomal protein S4e [Candidatus Heimdallarchaeota archaeon]
MGSKGISRHKKRLNAPITYSIARKHGVFTVRPLPGKRKEVSLPLGIILREILGYAKTLSEVKKILKKEIVKVDGQVMTSYKSQVGLLDTLEITAADEYYRLIPYRGKRRLMLRPISSEQASRKPLRVEKKKTVRGGLVQLAFHDGRTLLIDPTAKGGPPIEEISPKNTVLFNLETKEIEENFSFSEGNLGLVIGGHNVGLSGEISEIETQLGRKNRIVTLNTEEGPIKTTDNHIFIIGQKNPIIDLSPLAPEGESDTDE